MIFTFRISLGGIQIFIHVFYELGLIVV